MGYELHITRRKEWSDPQSGPPITRAEFEEVVLADPRFERDQDMPNYANFLPHPRHRHDAAWLLWRDGEIVTKSPTQSFTKVAVHFAQRLNARAVGDEGEQYGPDGNVVDEDEQHKAAIEADDVPVQTDAEVRSRLRRERARNALGWIGMMCFLVMTLYLLGKQLHWW